MSGSASISGLASGLDTATIIDQLMQLEAVPQSRLQDRVSREQLVVNAMQTLNSKVASLATRAADLTEADAWSALTVTSSNDQVTVSTDSSADPISFTIQVDRTALTHRLEFTDAVALAAPGTIPTTVRLDRLDGTTVDLTTDGTLQGLLDSVNDAVNGTGLRATAVRVGTDQYRLLVESTETGAATDFTLTDAADGSPLLGGVTVRAGQDAQVTLGSSIVVTATSNTFADLVPGVTLTLAPGATGSSDVVVRRDPAKMADTVTSLVDAVNAVLADIDSLTSYDPVTKASGMLSGEASARSLRGAILGTVFPPDGSSLADLGIQTDRSGRLVFDEAAFTDAFAADPAAVEARFTAPDAGFAARLQQVSEAASDQVDGTLTAAITGRNSAIERLNDSIAAWDQRLELRRNALTRQFTALEVALSQMNGQSAWLAGQINSLPTIDSGS